MNAVEAEQAVIGCMILKPEICEKMFRKISAKMFSEHPLAVIFNCFYKLHKAGTVPDFVTVISKLGEDYKVLLASCAELTPSISRAEYYADCVLESWRVRDLLQTAGEILACEGSSEIMQKMSAALTYQQKIQSTLDESTVKEFTRGAVEFLASLSQPDTSIKTGWEDFDRIVGGIQRKSVYVISARPGKGKTDWALQLAMKLSNKAKVHYHSMEMPTTQLMQRVASRAAKINSIKIRDKDLTPEETQKIFDVMDIMTKHSNIKFDEHSAITADMVEENILKYKPDVVFIDHLGLMNHGSKKNQWEAVADTTHRLKALAMQYNVAIVELVQKKRGGQGTPDMGDVYGGAAVEQDTDTQIYLEVEAINHILDGDQSADVTVQIVKNRNGGTGEIHFAWQPQYHNYIPIEWRNE